MILHDGKSALDRLAERVDTLDNVDAVVALTQPGSSDRLPQGWRAVTLDCRDGAERGLIETLMEVVQSVPGVDHLLYCQVDEPFLDPGLCRSMIEDHLRYAAEYSFADGYPAGLAPELLAPSVLPRLLALVRDGTGLSERDALFQIIQRDINAFDIETALSDRDMRMLRIALCCDSRRNWVLCRRLCERGATDAQRIVDTILADQRILRTLPAHVMIDVVEGSLQDVAYSPYRLFGPAGKGKQREMAPGDVAGIVGTAEGFSPGNVYTLGVWGEPGLHSDPMALIEAVGDARLVIETSGVGWDEAALDQILRRSRSNLSWIVHLDAVDAEIYRSVRGDGFERATAFTELLLEHAASSTYVQTVRYSDVEEHTEAFYRHWKKRTENIIVQKYDHYCGVLDDKRISDISPVNRFPCWHLKRELLVLVDGSVPLCREDLHGAHSAGNLLNDGIERVWEALEPFYERHVDEDYPSLCRNCDEYYTFNF